MNCYVPSEKGKSIKMELGRLFGKRRPSKMTYTYLDVRRGIGCRLAGWNGLGMRKPFSLSSLL